MEPEALDLELFLPYRLNRLADAVSREFSKIYRDRHGLTRPEWRTLATLGQFGTMTATAIGAHSAMHKTKVSRAVAELEKRRWVTRTPNSADRRVEHLALTAAGLAAYREIVPLAKAFEDEVMARASNTQRKAIEAGLSGLEAVFVHDAGRRQRAAQAVRDLKTSGRRTGIRTEDILSARDEGRKPW